MGYMAKAVEKGFMSYVQVWEALPEVSGEAFKGHPVIKQAWDELPIVQKMEAIGWAADKAHLVVRLHLWGFENFGVDF